MLPVKALFFDMFGTMLDWRKGGPLPHEPVDLIVQSALELADALGLA